MTCSECGFDIPDGKLVCLPCLEKRAWRGAVEARGSHLPDIQNGRLALRLCRKFRWTGTQHLALPNHYASWCGIDLRDHKHVEKKPLDLARVAPAICRLCVIEIDRLIEVAK